MIEVNCIKPLIKYYENSNTYISIIQYKNKDIIVTINKNKITAQKILNEEYTYITEHLEQPKTKYYIYISKDKNYYFPAWYSLNKKKSLINNIVKYFPELFTYNLSKANNDIMPQIIEYRLNILGSYLLHGQFKKKSGLTVSEYKQKQIKKYEYSINALDTNVI